MAKSFKTVISIDDAASAASEAIRTKVAGDSQARLSIDVGGKLTWSSGAATGDTTLYRDSANTLKTDDAFAAASLDISGNADIDGTLEADAITVDGTALNEYIADTIGAMVGSNTETGISVTYDDSDNTLDFVVSTLNQDTTGNSATATALETARTIGGVSFDGTANIDLPGVNSSGNQDTSGTAANATNAAGLTGTPNVTVGSVTATTGAYSGDVTLTNTGTDSSAGPIIALYRNSSSPADADYLGQIKFQGENDNDQQVNYAKITGKISDASDGSEDGIIEFAHVKAGSQNISGRWNSTTLQLINGTSLSVAGDADVTGDVDVDGTLEADAITVNGTALNEYISDTVGAMVTSNTETGVAVTYDDSDNTLDFVIGTLNQDTTGNAATATALATARNIGGVSFDGTGNIDLPGVNSSGNQNTSGNAATATALETARNIGGVSFDGTANINLPGVNTSGSQDTSGNAATATALATARNVGGVSFDGTGNIDLPGVNSSGNQDTSGTAALATSVTVTANNSTDETVYPVFVDGATGTQGAETDSALTYNPSSGNLSIGGELSAATLDISGNVDIDGSLETDGLSINGAITFPTADGSADQVLTTNGSGTLSWANQSGGGGGSPGGSNTQIQYNNSGSFAGSANLTFDGSDLVVGGGKVAIGDSSAMRNLDVVADIMIHHADDDHAWLWSVDTDGNNEMWYQSTYSGGDSGWSQKLNMDTSGKLTLYGEIDGPQDFYVGNGEGELILFQGSNNILFFQSNGTYRASFNANGHFVPYANDTYNLGGSGAEWGDLYIDVVKVSNEVQAGNGSVSDPSYTFSSDGDTGIFRKAANQLGIAVGGVEHYFTSAGLYLASGDWFRCSGSTGLYNSTYGTGMYSTDSSWFKGYSSSHGIQSQGGLAANITSTSSLSGYNYVVRSGWTSFHYYTSSREFKDQISNFTDSGPIVDALNPVMFVSKPDPEDTPEEAAWRANDWNYGFIAEEICENDVTAKLGQYDPEFKPNGWKWPDVISVLTAEVKSLRARVATLEGS